MPTSIALTAFMNRELYNGSGATQRTRYWWARKGNGSYVDVGVGDLTPVQINQLIEQFCTDDWVVVASPVQRLPSSSQELTEQHVVLCAAGYYCVRRERMNLEYGAIGDTAAVVWRLIRPA